MLASEPADKNPGRMTTNNKDTSVNQISEGVSRLSTSERPGRYIPPPALQQSDRGRSVSNGLGGTYGGNRGRGGNSRGGFSNRFERGGYSSYGGQNRSNGYGGGYSNSSGNWNSGGQYQSSKPRFNRPYEFDGRSNADAFATCRRDPEDQFASRLDVGPRDERVETTLFGKQNNSGINFDKYDDIPVETSGEDVPRGIDDFETSGIDDLLKHNIGLARYTNPTPVQKNSIPIVTAGRDLMACAQTGSGKTAAFLLPVLSENFQAGIGIRKPVATDPNSGILTAYPSTLILAPTRELCLQIYDEARKFCYRSWVRPVCIYGGAAAQGQIADLSRGCDLLAATPGRLVDLVERGYISLSNIHYLVLDEADRMLDMGFEPQIRRIVQEMDMPDVNERQTLMFSATFPKDIQAMARDFLKSYVFLTVGRVGSTSENITQSIEYVEEHDKKSVLLDVLHSDIQDAESKGSLQLTLVFVETKRGCDDLARYLSAQNIPATAIHGDRSQRERESALRSFREGYTPILVATAVAARGLDIPNVKHVINFDLPNDIDDYVHRIGRTGRAGNVGKATAFFNSAANRGVAKQLIEILKEANQPIPDWLYSCSAIPSSNSKMRKNGAYRGRGGSRFGAYDSRSGGGSSNYYGGYNSGSSGRYQSNYSASTNDSSRWF